MKDDAEREKNHLMIYMKMCGFACVELVWKSSAKEKSADESNMAKSF